MFLPCFSLRGCSTSPARPSMLFHLSILHSSLPLGWPLRYLTVSVRLSLLFECCLLLISYPPATASCPWFLLWFNFAVATSSSHGNGVWIITTTSALNILKDPQKHRCYLTNACDAFFDKRQLVTLNSKWSYLQIKGEIPLMI